MKFDMYVKNIMNMKFNNLIFKIHKKKKKEIYEKLSLNTRSNYKSRFEEKICRL